MPYALFEVNDEWLRVARHEGLGDPTATFTDHEVSCIRITIGVVSEQSRKLWEGTGREDTYTNIWNKLRVAWNQIKENEKK